MQPGGGGRQSLRLYALRRLRSQEFVERVSPGAPEVVKRALVTLSELPRYHPDSRSFAAFTVFLVHVYTAILILH